ncbi:hypothetical protein B0A55_12298 [Friedmanniomyces simplex]|uniref:Uncharacterized protein n=1 Tax=Friedmanniomyces simplex TaxID=329884 RepID=A0A4U0VZN3_9PEZI|nr:hypothetical protein B0A55_12298 [Friedmanniomyces simplex]
MPLGEALEDDYVISLLERDAKTHKPRSSLGSLLSAGPRVRSKDAPKPNTRFLRNIIRETDSHNAALKAKEEEESRARLRDLRRDDKVGKRKREDGSGERAGKREDGSGERAGKRVKGGERDGRWASALGGLGKTGVSSGSSERRGEAGNTYMPSTIDSRFASRYDPAADVVLDEAEEDRDDWDMALEALRDRAKWKTNQAERLKAAGFTDEEVGRWEKGGERGEKDVEDVKWRKKGEGREWDRGKVVDEEGGVETKAEWAR